MSGAEAEGAASREATRKSELREIVANLVQAGNLWADTMQILVLSTGSGEWKQSDWVDWVNTDSGRGMTQSAQSVDRSIRKLRLSTDEESLVLPALEVQLRMKNDEAFGFFIPLPKEAETTGPPPTKKSMRSNQLWPSWS